MGWTTAGREARRKSRKDLSKEFPSYVPCKQGHPVKVLPAALVHHHPLTRVRQDLAKLEGREICGAGKRGAVKYRDYSAFLQRGLLRSCRAPSPNADGVCTATGAWVGTLLRSDPHLSLKKEAMETFSWTEWLGAALNMHTSPQLGLCSDGGHCGTSLAGSGMNGLVAPPTAPGLLPHPKREAVKCLWASTLAQE